MEYKILVIEDNLADAKLLEITLNDVQEFSCRIDRVARLNEALEIIEKNKYDAIFLDLTLPDSTGIETVESLTNVYPNCNVLVMTGLDDEKVGIGALKAGAQDYIIKGTYDAKSLGKTLVYSIERNAINKKLEETQRLAHIGSWVYNRSEKHLYASNEACEIFGIEYKRDGYFLHELDETSRNILEELSPEGKKSATIKYLVEKQEKYVFISVSDARNQKQGEIQGIIQDITERKKSIELQKAHDLAKKSAEMKEQFVASISHEMRTPMNAILGMSNLALQTDLDNEQNEYLHAIKQSSEMLLGIVNDILEFSSIQKGKIKFESKVFDLRKLLENMNEVMKYKIKEKNLELSISIDELIPTKMIGDYQRLNQVIFNLIGNAIKFTDEGFIKLTVRPINDMEDSIRLEFCVEDSGIGIPEDKIDVIFDSFTRIEHKDRIFEGTGLGLAIAKNYIELQDGRMWAKSNHGNGAKFFFELDFAKDKDRGVVEEEETTVFDEISDFALLLVEDNKMNQLVAKKTISKKWPNAIIDIAENGKECIDFVKSNTYNIILMDIQMPIMNGYEATDYIRKNIDTRLPILAMTAHANVEKEPKFHGVGFSGIVLKPFVPEELFSKIQHNLRMNQPIEEKGNMDKIETYIDLTYMDTFIAGDDDMKSTLIEMLLTEIPEEVDKMKTSISKEEWDELFQISHKFKSTIAYIGNKEFSKANNEIVEMSRTQTNLEKVNQEFAIIDLLAPPIIELLKAEV